MKLTDFDRIACVSLDLRKKDWPRLDAEFQQRGAVIDRFVVGKGRTLPLEQYDQIDPTEVPPNWKKEYSLNAYGCYCAHRSIIEKSQKDGVGTLLMLEDDCTLLSNFDTVLEKVSDQIKKHSIEWDMLQIGANYCWGKTREISPNLVQCLQLCYCWHCVAIPNHMFQVLLDLPPVGNFDYLCGTLIQPRFKCYGVWPVIAPQKHGFSYLNGRIEDYGEYFKSKGQTE